jgi:cellulose 1,4-beta-cellobiosidase
LPNSCLTLYATAPGAKLLADIHAAAGSPRVRGFAVNVAGYDAWKSNPGEFENIPEVKKYNRALDEQRFVGLFSAEMEKLGITDWKAIMDTSRNGLAGVRADWTRWCNVVGAGLGVKSTDETDDPMVDAFAWIKTPGESDGTSDISSRYYSSSCWSERGMS